MMKKWTLLTAILFLFPTIAMGADEFLAWESAVGDKSIYYLGLAFGQVGTVLLGEGGQVFGAVFQAFNLVVLTLGAIVITHNIIHMTLTTAHQGEVLGQKWSSVWMPLKGVGGLALLLPTSTGYSLIQILMMWIILQGIHGANQLWYLVIERAKTGAGVTTAMEVHKRNLADFTTSLFQSAICMQRANNDVAVLERLGGYEVEMYIAPNGQELYVGVNQDDTQFPYTCGIIRPAPPPQIARNADEWRQRQFDGAELAFSLLLPYAEEAVMHPYDPGQWSGQSIIMLGSNGIKGQVINFEVNDASTSIPEPIADLLASMGWSSSSRDDLFNLIEQDGWIHAGAYYSLLMKTTENVTLQPPSFVLPAQNNFVFYTIDGLARWEQNIVPYSDNYLSFSEIGGDPLSDAALSLSSPSGLSEEAQEALGDTVGHLSEVALNFMDTMTSDSGDPITSIRDMGLEIMNITESIFWGLLIGVPLIMLLACLESITQPSCFVAGILVMLLMPILILFLALLWGAGVFLGMYVPLIPFVVFTFTAIGYLILCIETIVAAPIVALGITAPGHDAMGRASPAVLLITNVMLRPALMIIGFIAAVRLVTVAVGMVNYGIQMFVINTASNLMVFGSLAIIVVYAGIAVAVIQTVFSLIYVIPDKVIRWIGGQAEQSSVESQLQKVEKASESGAQASGGLMKGGMEGIQTGLGKLKEAQNKASGGASSGDPSQAAELMV